MKKYNLLSLILLAISIISCNDSNKDKSDWFSVNSSTIKSQFSLNETANFEVLNLKNKKIDSVIYYLNSNRKGKTEGLSKFDFDFGGEKLGYQNLKALIYTEGSYAEVTHRIELISDIQPKLLNYTIINTYPHDVKAYTQGLEFFGDFLYEGTGNGEGIGTGTRGKSSIRKTDYKTGKVHQIVELNDQFFGEGITILNNKVYQLTWTSLVGFVYDAESLEQIQTFNYTKRIQGWGLCNDGEKLYQSDGTEKIWIMNPETFEMEDYINVYSGNSKIKAVNELEWIDGKIYGNVYQKDAVAVIDPKTGSVEAIINLVDLKSKVTQHPDLDVLNGIAYNPVTKTIFVTGKNWDKMFEIKIED
ncbi:MAG TPA: glutaminyl-peptide cyclotransferase [Flavobacterium sp.]|nr:glutaminyl-peptide cyclotransferase [Flavobacterium sp.]